MGRGVQLTSVFVGAAAFASLLLGGGAVRCAVDERRPREKKRRAVSDDEALTGGARIRAVALPGAKSVTWSEDVVFRAGHVPPRRVRPDTYVGQEGRANPHYPRDFSAHRIASRYARAPRWLTQVRHVSTISDDMLEPIPFKCTKGSAKAFAHTIADHVSEFTDSSVEGIAVRMGELYSSCPRRCHCMHGILGNVSTPASCTQESHRKFATLRESRLEILQLLSAQCENRCQCLRHVHVALAACSKREDAPRRFALSLLHHGPAASMSILDVLARTGGELGVATASDFASVVSRELGPYTVMATDVLAVWVRTRGGAYINMTTGIYRSLIHEEVTEAFYRCQDCPAIVPRILRIWHRPEEQKCNEGMMVLAAEALAKLFKASGMVMRARVRQYCQKSSQRHRAE
mmetsp:Transcript_29190/g.83791  ORF Transcript_29190/g.83791 Transcript_29190/m.83791 type:complete len:404 (+) Transcript_29190:80-1291(+)